MKISVIELEDISFIRQGRAILSGVNWRIETGRHWALIGANGPGVELPDDIVQKIAAKYIEGYERLNGKKFAIKN